MSPERPVAVIGLDAVDHRLVEHWAAEGELPVFADLLQRGAYGLLKSTAAVFSGSAWLSIATGCGPGTCGVYSRYQLVSGTYNVRRIKAAECKVEPFWASFAGPVVVADVPKAPLLSNIHGVQVVEWGAYDHYSQFSTYPAHLSHHIANDFGRHPFLDHNFEVALHSRRDFHALHQVMIEGIRMKQRLNLALLNAVQPRLFFSVFGEPHAAGHAFWRFQDARHPAHDSKESCANFLRDVYRAIDEALGELLHALPREAIFVVVSSQGFGMDSMADENFLSELLLQLGVSVARSNNAKYAPYAPAMALDTARSRAFSLPTDLQGYIRMNLKGREPNGVVAESEYNNVCQELEHQLLAVRHRSSGVPVVREVVRVRDRFAGAFADHLPDLSVIWSDDQVVMEVELPDGSVVRRRPDLSGGGGNHRGPGFMLVSGIGVKRSRFAGNVFDIAPTVCALLGENPRAEWEGNVLSISGLDFLERKAWAPV